MTPRVRVLIVEDSLTVRKRMCEVLAEDPEMEVVGEAADGKRAIELCQAMRPDVVSMDMMLPVMSGLAATEYIMAYCPTPILVVSSSFNRGELFHTYEALAAGAVDVLDKPREDAPEGSWERQLVAALKMVARIRVITHPRARLGLSARPPAPARSHQPQAVVMGASTGGPAALVQVLRTLPADFRLPILLVVHLSKPFAAAFADWLDAQTGRPVRYATEGESLAAAEGSMVLAPPELHLILRDGRLRLTQEAERHSCRPSVDVLFESAARELGADSIGCLLTGMGRDGASGLLALRRAGAATIAQDEASSVVYGMPREAALLEAAEQILPLNDIGPALAALAGARR